MSDLTLDERARVVIGRALDAVAVAVAVDPAQVVAGEPPGPDRSGPGWGTWVVAVGAVVAAVVGFAVLVPDRTGTGSDEADVAAAIAPPPCGVELAHGPDDETVVDAGPLPDGRQWRVVFTGTPPTIALWAVVPGLENGAIPEAGVPAFVRGGLAHDAASWWSVALRPDFGLTVTNVPGGYVAVAEVPPATARIEVVEAGAVVASACTRSIEGIDRARYAGTFFTASAANPPTFRAVAADGRLLAQTDLVPPEVWVNAESAGGTNWQLVVPPEEAGATTTIPTWAGPPAPHGDPCGEEPPPFRIEAPPAGIDPEPIRYADYVRALTGSTDAIVPEPYDPRFVLGDPADPDRRIDVFHGNSWRLATEVQGELTLLGRTAWRSTLPDGSTVLDFQLTGTGEACDIWSLRNGTSVTEAELMAAAESLLVNG